MNKLYRLTQTNKKTGETKVIYGHATSNVMDQFWQAYVDKDHSVTIEEYQVTSDTSESRLTPNTSVATQNVGNHE